MMTSIIKIIFKLPSEVQALKCPLKERFLYCLEEWTARLS